MYNSYRLNSRGQFRGDFICDVEIDLAGKQGAMSKIINVTFQYNNKTHADTYQLTFNVKKEISEHNTQEYGEKLFGPKCGTCHAEPAKNKYGKAPFSKVCGFCHGKMRKEEWPLSLHVYLI